MIKKTANYIKKKRYLHMPKNDKLNPNKYRNYCTVKRLHNCYCLIRPSGLKELQTQDIYFFLSATL